MPSTDQAILFASTYREMPDPQAWFVIVCLAAAIVLTTVTVALWAQPAVTTEGVCE